MVTRPGRTGYYADFMVNGRRAQKTLSTDFETANSMIAGSAGRAD
jgi:hypothetical protein